MAMTSDRLYMEGITNLGYLMIPISGKTSKFLSAIIGTGSVAHGQDRAQEAQQLDCA